MTYTKPDIGVASSALRAIESLSEKPFAEVLDHIDQVTNADGPAYQADE
jgi:hypothetical protein